jgi:hypothetical protein
MPLSGPRNTVCLRSASGRSGTRPSAVHAAPSRRKQQLVRRTGAKATQVRYSDDEQPVIWMAVVEWRVDVRVTAEPSAPAALLAQPVSASRASALVR